MWLTFRSGPRSGETVEVTGERFVVGRASACDLTIREHQLSRRHASLTPLPSGRAEVEDLGSKNGTFVDDTRIQAPVTLAGGERLRFGDTELAVSKEPPGADRTRVATARKEPERSDSLVQRIRLERNVRRNAIIGSTALSLAVVLVVLTIAGVFDRDGGEQTDVGDIVADVEPSTVVIQARRKGRKLSTGTGWVLDAGARQIVTNNHVINGGDALHAGVDEDLPEVAKDLRNAQIVAAAPCEDIALLRLGNAEGLRSLPVLSEQDELKQGETVIAIGFPENASLEAQLTATQGVVSVKKTAFNEPTVDAPRFSNLVQTDAAINPGNSGGPLVDLDSRLVGMNTAVRTERAGGSGVIQGQGYAIGVDRIRAVVERLRRGDSLGWAGFRSLQPGPGGALTASDPAGGTPAAERFGGDAEILIRAIDGKQMNGTLARYCTAIGRKGSDESATLTVGAQGATRNVRLRLP